MTPTIGRILWFYTRGGKTGPLPAIVVEVRDDGLLGLFVFAPHGSRYEPKVPLHPDTRGDGAYCTWPGADSAAASAAPAVDDSEGDAGADLL